MKGKNVVHSKGKDDWRTPQWLYDHLNTIYNFKLDAAADEDNALCTYFFDAESNALKHSWSDYGNVFVNPPYSKNFKFVTKAFEESLKKEFKIVMLLPSRTCSKWWHDYVIKYASHITFIRTRVVFVGAEHGAGFPSCIIEFGGDSDGQLPLLSSWDIRKFQSKRKPKERNEA